MKKSQLEEFLDFTNIQHAVYHFMPTTLRLFKSMKVTLVVCKLNDNWSCILHTGGYRFFEHHIPVYGTTPLSLTELQWCCAKLGLTLGYENKDLKLQITGEVDLTLEAIFNFIGAMRDSIIMRRDSSSNYPYLNEFMSIEQLRQNLLSNYSLITN